MIGHKYNGNDQKTDLNYIHYTPEPTEKRRIALNKAEANVWNKWPTSQANSSRFIPNKWIFSVEIEWSNKIRLREFPSGNVSNGNQSINYDEYHRHRLRIFRVILMDHFDILCVFPGLWIRVSYSWYSTLLLVLFARPCHCVCVCVLHLRRNNRSG